MAPSFHHSLEPDAAPLSFGANDITQGDTNNEGGNIRENVKVVSQGPCPQALEAAAILLGYGKLDPRERVERTGVTYHRPSEPHELPSRYCRIRYSMLVWLPLA